jgi:NAD(P)-dependent dehydrogenase (short-subunit alcohol dehydrogenase family)
MADRIKDKVVVVTGAAQGIGFGIARRLAAEGGRVVIADKQTEKGEAAAADIRAEGSEAFFQRCDVTAEAECAALMDAAMQRYGRLDGLVNNVGWYPRATLEDTTSELWEAVMNVNLRSAFYCCKYAVPKMQACGGSIVNIGSVHGIQAYPNLIAYGAAKGGLLTLTRTLAGAYGRDRIRANYLIPGWVMTEGELALNRSKGVSEAELQQMASVHLLGRHQTPDDAAHTVVFLISDESSQITGSILHVDAGMSALTFREQRMG